jgi:proteasome assembly chaperone (PAC2) family protein
MTFTITKKKPGEPNAWEIRMDVTVTFDDDPESAKEACEKLVQILAVGMSLEEIDELMKELLGKMKETASEDAR